MKGFRFYEELKNKNRKAEESQGNVIAVYGEWRLGRVVDEKYQWVKDCVSAVFFETNSQVCGSSVSQGYLEESTRRISEAKAREIHPNLFVYLDS